MFCMESKHHSPVLYVSTSMQTSKHLSNGNMFWLNFIDKGFVIHGKTEINRNFYCKMAALSL